MANIIKNLGYSTVGGIPFGFKGIRNAAKKFYLGTPTERDNVSTLRPEQEGLYNQLQASTQGEGAGGGFGTTADYYRNLMSDNPMDYNAYADPMRRQYEQETVPGISEQFAGMGAGGLSSSGFRNAQVGAATDLAERLGQLRSQLKQQGAAGLQQVGGLGLQNYSQNMVTKQGSQGFLSAVAPAIGTAVGTYFGGPAGGMAGAGVGNGVASGFSGFFGNAGSSGNKVGANSHPYGNSTGEASPSLRT